MNGIGRLKALLGWSNMAVIIKIENKEFRNLKNEKTKSEKRLQRNQKITILQKRFIYLQNHLHKID